MRAEHHLGLSVFVGGCAGALFQSWQVGVAAFVSGVFMDVDHAFDYLREFGWPRSPRHFFAASYEGLYKKIYLVFHAWEWLPILVGVALWTHHPWAIGAAIGWTIHMACDQAANTRRASTYFFLGRWRARFDHDTLFPPDAPSAPHRGKSRRGARPS